MRKKLSIDLTAENMQALESIKANCKTPYSTVINQLISLFINSPADVRNTLKEHIIFCRNKTKEYREMAGVNGKYDLDNKFSLYNEMITLLNGGIPIPYDTSELKKQILLAQGNVLIYPSEYQVLNEEKQRFYTKAIIIEFTNPQIYKYPSFIYLCEKDAERLDEEDKQEINDLLKEKWKEYPEVCQKQVKLVTSSENNLPINESDYKNAPIMNFFNVYKEENLRHINPDTFNKLPIIVTYSE